MRIPIDILQIIVDFSDFNTGLAIIIVNKETNKKLKIKYIKNENKLTDEILKQQKFSHLKVLNVCDNKKVSTVNHLVKLEELNVGASCGIDQNGIAEINLKKLNASDNYKIKDVNHMNKLEE